MVLNMRRLVQAVFQASCKCPKGKNPHPLCVFHSVLFMVPLCKGGIRCEICIGLGPDSIDLRQLIAEQLSSCAVILTTDMLDAYADAMRDYKIPFGWSEKDYRAARRETNDGMNRTFPGYDPRFRLPFLPLLTEELAMKRYRMTDLSDAKEAVQEAGRQLSADEPVELEPVVTKPTYKNVLREHELLTTVSEDDIVRNSDGEVTFVHVPPGFPKWLYWLPVPGTTSFQVIDTMRHRLWLFKAPSFKCVPLTPAILDADDPWEYATDAGTVFRRKRQREASLERAANKNWRVDVSERDIQYNEDGTIKSVRVPAGYPEWPRWKKVARTLTHQVVDLKNQALWLFRFHTFDRRPLTDEILAASDPWYYVPPGNQWVDRAVLGLNNPK